MENMAEIGNTPGNDSFDQIEAYLAGSLTPGEKQAFEAELEKDSHLAQMLKMHKAAHVLLAHGASQRLKEQMQTMTTEFSPKVERKLIRPQWQRYVPFAAAFLLLGLCLGWLWLSRTHTPSALVQTYAEAYPSVSLRGDLPTTSDPFSSGIQA